MNSNIVDGAIFAFVSGTNPEVLLVLEAHRGEGALTWHYGLARLTGEPIFVELRGEEVWSRPLAEPPTVRESYLNGWISISQNRP